MTSEWIPVSKRLPEAGEYDGDVAKYYLVQNEYGDILIASIGSRYISINPMLMK